MITYLLTQEVLTMNNKYIVCNLHGYYYFASGLIVTSSYSYIHILACTALESILPFKILAHDHAGVWPSRGAGKITNEILQTTCDTTLFLCAPIDTV